MVRGSLAGLLRVSVLVGEHRDPSPSLWPIITSLRTLSTWLKARSAWRYGAGPVGQGHPAGAPILGGVHAPAVRVRGQVPVA